MPKKKDERDHPEIARRLIEGTLKVRIRTLQSLQKWEVEASLPHVDQAFEMLEDEEDDVRIAAVKVLRRVEPVTVLVSRAATLVGRLDDVSPEVRRCVLQILLKFDPTLNVPYGEYITRQLGDDACDVCNFALNNLRRIAPICSDHEHAMLAKIVEKLFKDESPEVRWCSLEAIGVLGNPEIESRAGLIVQHLADEDTDVHWSALERFRQLDPPLREPHLEFLLELLYNPLTEVRWCATEALGELLPESLIPHLEDLIRLLDDASSDVRRAVYLVLRRLGDEVLLPHQGLIAHLLGDADAELRKSTAKTWCGLEKIRPLEEPKVEETPEEPKARRKSALEAMIDAAQDEDAEEQSGEPLSPLSPE